MGTDKSGPTPPKGHTYFDWSICLLGHRFSPFSDWVGRFSALVAKNSPSPFPLPIRTPSPPPFPGSSKIPPPPIGVVYQLLMQEVVFESCRLDFLEIYLKQPDKTPYGGGGIWIPNQKAYPNKVTLTCYLIALFAVVCGVDRGLTMD